MREMHHFYIGIFVVAAAWVAIFRLHQTEHEWPELAILAGGGFGVWMIADDLWQHWRQRRNPAYHSPVHRLWVWVVRRLR